MVLHFGDHDPSGLDMTRDVEERLDTFLAHTAMHRLALNMAQVKKFKLPPNPARESDARFAGYKRQFGHESWELDALDPSVLGAMVQKAVLALRDDGLWAKAVKRQESDKKKLLKVAARWAHMV